MLYINKMPPITDVSRRVVAYLKSNGVQKVNEGDFTMIDNGDGARIELWNFPNIEIPNDSELLKVDPEPIVETTCLQVKIYDSPPQGKFLEGCLCYVKEQGLFIYVDNQWIKL
jgi:hypothetical protein